MALTKEQGINFLSNCEGYHQALKAIHWSTEKKAEHLLTDDIDSDVLDFEDRIAESIMGILGMRYGNGELKTMLPSATDLKALLNEMEEDVFSFIDEVGEDKKVTGLVNILEEFCEKITTWKYLETFN